MTRYTIQVDVVETTTYEYVIDADSPEEALAMAESGETVAETVIQLQGVDARYPNAATLSDDHAANRK